MQIRKQPYHFLFLGGILVFLLSFFTADRVVDIYIFDTYYIIPVKIIILIISVFLFLTWLFYRFLSRFFYSTLLISVHAVLTTLCFLFFIFICWKEQIPARGISSDIYSLNSAAESFKSFNSQQLATLLTLVVIQFIFLLNLVLGIFVKGTRKDDTNNHSHKRRRRRHK